MLSNMASSLILHKRITTTIAKAKALRVYVEPLITKSKNDSTHSRRVVFSYLQDKIAVSELFREVSPKVADRPGGYTRILKIGNRLGDNADMCVIELVDYNENMLEAKTAKTKTTRRRRGGKKKVEGQEATVVSTDVKTEKAEKTDTTPDVEEKEPASDLAEEVKESAPEKVIEAASEEKSASDTEASVEVKEDKSSEETGESPEKK
ncbi:MAG: 50S ribosomal protein L17 [Bacteroidetes bacterium]|nr:MAG: 50S ribosomal protein L17 [Bacteroidota bacterium]